jgi:acetylornithine/succinyldiaminopimelate/putrescine aminotransferase
MQPRHPFTETCEQILREQRPNLLRLYVNPSVVQTCFCLGCYVQQWGRPAASAEEFQTFLANGFDEALNGAIKLARYCASVGGRPTSGLILDAADRVGTFAAASVAGGGKVEFLPGLVVGGRQDDLGSLITSRERFGFVLLVAAADGSLGPLEEAARSLIQRDGPLVIVCVDRAALAALRRAPACLLRRLSPDVVVFDESFVNHDVPFGAFTARKELYDHWNTPGKATFHSTTYQPNTISTLHFVRCLRQADPEFHAEVAQDLERIDTDFGVRRELFRRLYSPSLYKATCATGFDTPDIRAAGDFITVAGRKVFDAVSGVACSVRGHNPAGYTAELQQQGTLEDCRAELGARLRALTGLEQVLPAVSGATAVENALKLALVAKYPRRHVLALKAGFGGKTLLALTGTWTPSYKEHIGPLYGEVLYVDPFAPDATAQLEAALTRHPVAVVQVELIQAVGGVRRVPEQVIRFLEARRSQFGYLLLVDEVQTGMYRTGPFTLSRQMGLSPDLLTLGKGTSDMMFPFALLQYSATVQAKLERAGSDLPETIRQRYGYEVGYRTVLNVLRHAEEMGLAERVVSSGALFAELLDGVRACRAVRDVRVYGLLLGIELDTARWPRRWFRKRLYSFYLLSMLRHPRYPVLAGFCQCEPNVLKITPALTVAPEEIRQVCATIREVLRRPFYQLLGTALGGLIRSLGLRRRQHERGHVPVPEPGPR